jgi:hypothetical protein
MVPDVVSLEAATVDAGPTSAMKILVIISITRIDELVLLLRVMARGHRKRIITSRYLRFSRALENPRLKIGI